MQDEIFILEKSIWTQGDFEIMGWHDANIYGLAFEKNEDTQTCDMLFDIDYIFKWVQPVPPKPSFTFWVAPCTLIFKEAFSLQIDINTEMYILEGLEIDDLNLVRKIAQDGDEHIYDWEIQLQQGVIKLQSKGLTQIVRQEPKHINSQTLHFDERGGVCFERKAYR